MTVQLRIVLDQGGADADEAGAALSLTRGLIGTAPRGCAVSAIVPSASRLEIDGLHDVRTLALGRRELAAAWQMGIGAGAGGGLIHAPSLMAPLVRHDRVHDNDQTTVTLWDLSAWEAPETLPKAQVLAQRAMLKRAVRHADAVVVPSHAMAERLVRIAPLGDRVRVIAGAAPEGFARAAGVAPTDGGAVTDDADGLPERYVVLTGEVTSLADGLRAVARAEIDAVILDVGEERRDAVTAAAAEAGADAARVHIRSHPDTAERAALLHGAQALVAGSTATRWPWRVVEAMEFALPIIAVDSDLHRDVIADGGALVAAGDLSDALADALGDGGRRLRVLATDRARAFSWASAAERVWALHAEL